MSIIKFVLFIVLYGFLICVGAIIAITLVDALFLIKRQIRKQKTNRRIISQAKAAGVWEKPQCLGGKALELKAWQDFKIKRKPGETDACLRIRCMNKAENEYAGEGVSAKGEKRVKYKKHKEVFSYFKENNPDIDMCLNCQSQKCNGYCAKIKKARHKQEE